jgi:hypothetical protein
VTTLEAGLTIHFAPSVLAERDAALRASLLAATQVSCVCGLVYPGPRDSGWTFVIDGNDDPTNTVPSLFGHGWLWTGNETNALCPEHAAPEEIVATFAPDPEDE